jgi:hypothetical protein
MPELRSSHIRSAEYSGGTLKITFHNGKTYAWEGIPERVYTGLLRAKSPGRFFHRFVAARPARVVAER